MAIQLGSIAAKKLGPLRAESDEMLHLDALRFIAAFGIMAIHFRTHLDVDGRIQIFIDRLVSFGLFVDLFFMISGYVIVRFYGQLSGPASYGKFLQKRIARLAPLHWATAIICALFGILFSLGILYTDTPQHYDFRRLAPNLLAVHGWWAPGLSFNYVSWSISAEWGLYLLLPLILFLRKWRLVLPSAIGLLVLLSVLPGEPWYERTYNLGIVRALPSFLLGVGLYDARATIARLPMPNLWLLASLCLFLAGTVGGAPPLMLLPAVYMAVVAAAAADQSQKGMGAARLLAPLGTLTYSLYMLHPLVELGFIILAGERLLHLSGAAMNAWVVAAGLIAIAISYLSLELFEKPARTWISGLDAKRPAPAEKALTPATATPTESRN